MNGPEEFELEGALKGILDTAAAGLGVERVGLWMFDRDHTVLSSRLQYIAREGRFDSTPQRLDADKHSRYIEALQRMPVLATENPLNDPRTRELAEHYLIPNGITAMLDVPVWLQGRLVGALCHEHVGPTRRWLTEDISFAAACGQLVSTTLEVHEHRRFQALMARLERDRLRLAQLERIAREEIEARDDFIAVVSHELNTPLTAIQLALSGLAIELPAARETRSYAILDRQIRHLLRLTGDLIDATWLAQLELHIEPVDLTDIVDSVVERLRPQLDASGSTLTIDGESIEGDWDRRRLEQLFRHLLANAIKFGGGKPIEVSFHRKDHVVIWTVRDHGIGISKAELPRVFHRFGRVSPLRRYGGLGLGLYIAKRITELHDGHIEIDSAQDAGTTVTIRLPVEAHRAAFLQEPLAAH